MVKNQFRENVGKLYVADATESGGVLTYGTPREVSGIAKVGTAYTKPLTEVFESGSAAYSRYSLVKATVTVETQTMSHAERMKQFHGLTAPAGSDPYEIGGDADQPNRQAIGWHVKLNGGGYLCRWFYDAIAAPPDETEETSDDNGPKLSADSIEYTCKRAPGTGYIKREKIVPDMTEVAAFFASVDGVTPEKRVSALIYKVTVPAKSGTPQATHDAGTGYTAAIAWSPAPAGTFAATTAYTAIVTYTAAAGYGFPDDISADDVQGLPTSGTTSITVEHVSGSVVKITIAYAATAA